MADSMASAFRYSVQHGHRHSIRNICPCTDPFEYGRCRGCIHLSLRYTHENTQILNRISRLIHTFYAMTLPNGHDADPTTTSRAALWLGV